MADYKISVLIDDEFAKRVEFDALERQANRVLASEAVENRSELSVVVTNDDTVRDLNRRFRGKDEPTDVLSFGSAGQGEFAMPPEAEPQLGEVVISFPTALRQAEVAGRPVIDELRHLLTHGILHILGYDHETEDDEWTMHTREEEVLDGWRH